MLINFMFCNYLNKYKLRGSDMENYTKLSIKYLKFQKKRTILTILGVALASGILFVILTLYFSNFINTRDALRKQADYEIVLLPEQKSGCLGIAQTGLREDGVSWKILRLLFELLY